MQVNLLETGHGVAGDGFLEKQFVVRERQGKESGEFLLASTWIVSYRIVYGKFLTKKEKRQEKRIWFLELGGSNESALSVT